MKLNKKLRGSLLSRLHLRKFDCAPRGVWLHLAAKYRKQSENVGTARRGRSKGHRHTRRMMSHFNMSYYV